ncbi:MAG: nitroreductase family protein [Thermodesulfobacteriota bacterium]
MAETPLPDVLTAIHTRRSVRIFSIQSIPDELLQKGLAAAMAAPSAGNQQPWHFVLLRDKDLLQKVTLILPNAPMSRQAQAGVLICADLALEKYPGYWVLDCAAAVENLLLAAHGLGLGAVWTGVYPNADRMEGFRKLLNLPDSVMPHSFVPMGWPGSRPKAEDRFKPERIHVNGW